MFRYKLNNKSLFIAVIVILLCLACLSGATLAIFTSDVNDGKIGIVTTAGEVDVDIVDASNTSRSLVGSTLDFQLGEVIFEPGATFCTKGFKIKNLGNVTINFRVSISEDKKINMLDFDEAFTIWISKSPDGSSETTQLTEFVSEGLAPFTCTEDTYYICIKMKETAGNTFQGKVFDGVGITVYAVQGNVNP